MGLILGEWDEFPETVSAGYVMSVRGACIDGQQQALFVVGSESLTVSEILDAEIDTGWAAKYLGVTGNGYGTGYGDGYGTGYGDGYGTGDGYGRGDGYGYGDGYNDGGGYGDGYGDGYNDGDGDGDGGGEE
jgi:hypothetical protein